MTPIPVLIPLLLCAALLTTGCVSSPPTRLVDSTDAVLAAPLDQVKTALVSVLSMNGYPVRNGSGDDGIVMTGYRREHEGMWDWLLHCRFGVERSKVEATVSADSQDMTRLTISVRYEAKDHLWSTWQETTPPPHRGAASSYAPSKRLSASCKHAPRQTTIPVNSSSTTYTFSIILRTLPRGVRETDPTGFYWVGRY